uniref:Uncharacterized protein n=1 Tax=Oryza sativa subsp. japonica TaxID=39947 RepID=Q6H6J6_ORYSJ|nr:hypothetical protein [Oryza sativa Japonica Group]
MGGRVLGPSVGLTPVLSDVAGRLTSGEEVDSEAGKEEGVDRQRGSGAPHCGRVERAVEPWRQGGAAGPGRTCPLTPSARTQLLPPPLCRPSPPSLPPCRLLLAADTLLLSRLAPPASLAEKCV